MWQSGLAGKDTNYENALQPIASRIREPERSRMSGQGLLHAGRRANVIFCATGSCGSFASTNSSAKCRSADRSSEEQADMQFFEMRVLQQTTKDFFAIFVVQGRNLFRRRVRLLLGDSGFLVNVERLQVSYTPV